MKQRDMASLPFEKYDFADRLTRREYFAALALQGYLSNSEWYKATVLNMVDNPKDEAYAGLDVRDLAAIYSCSAADKLIKYLNETEDKK